MSDFPGPVEYLHSEILMELSWHVDPGTVMRRFFELLRREGRLYGMRCPQCRRVYLPPRPVCGNCWKEMTEWVPLGSDGTVVAKTVCHYSVLNSETGRPRQTPFVLALVKLDGADTTLNHFVEAEEIGNIHIGSRVKLVLRKQLRGNIGDIRHFQLV